MIEILLLKVVGLTWYHESSWSHLLWQTFLPSVLALICVDDSCHLKLHDYGVKECPLSEG